MSNRVLRADNQPYFKPISCRRSRQFRVMIARHSAAQHEPELAPRRLIIGTTPPDPNPRETIGIIPLKAALRRRLSGAPAFRARGRAKGRLAEPTTAGRGHHHGASAGA